MAKKVSKKALQRRLFSIVALALVALLIVSSIFGYFASAFAESEAAQTNVYTLEIELQPDQQVLHIQQHLVFYNNYGQDIDHVEFCVAPNVFRRETALFYENDILESVFPAGYMPGGIEFAEITVNGQPAEWALTGNELYLCIYTPVAAGEQCTFTFTYALLLTENRAFTGYSDADWRLSAFYPIACVYDTESHAFIRNTPMQHTRWLYAPAANYNVTVTLPGNYMLACTGSKQQTNNEDGSITWHIQGLDLQEFSMSFSRKWRLYSTVTEPGPAVNVYTNLRGADQRATDIAQSAIEALENWFGPFPTQSIEIVQSDIVHGIANYPGVIWVPAHLLEAENEQLLAHHLRFALAQQYFGMATRAEPVADAWLSDVICQYIAYLLLEEENGHDALINALEEDILPSVLITVPGGLNITSDADLFINNSREYDTLVLKCGTAVFQQLRQTMGREELLAGLQTFYRLGLEKDPLTEKDLVACLEAATGKDWEPFLTDWIFNLDEYRLQTENWFE